jgi:hypothetical protein
LANIREEEVRRGDGRHEKEREDEARGSRNKMTAAGEIFELAALDVFNGMISKCGIP